MSEKNKTYRINTKINSDAHVNVKLEHDYENFEILSLNINKEGVYKMHTSKYGCVAGRVLANGAYGIPNAKISVFIESEESDEIDPILRGLYPYDSVTSKDEKNIRYNTLPDQKLSECHQSVGTFPNKRLVLDDNNVLEIYDKYYKYTAVSNEAGDYMIFGVPVGEQIIHVDIDLSDIGELSQSPRDMIYKGYSVTQFESPTMFKKDTELDTLTQIISENASVFVNPFWGDDGSQTISITRKDIEVKYKFEPTCVFIGSLTTDMAENSISKNCIPASNMGRMDQLRGGQGTIEMIRKTIDDNVESVSIQGTKLIDGNGTWCYQIPMNLDYMGTDEYGNIVATNDPNKGIPTRARVRFRVSLSEGENKNVNNHLVKVLIPHNPHSEVELDYTFGSYTQDNDEGTKSFRDLFTNCVYTVKSYIPRFQKGNAQRNTRFSGIKNVTVSNGNNPIPYNNMRVNITFMFVLQCAILKMLIRIVRIINKWRPRSKNCITLGDGMCPDLEGWYFAPGCRNLNKTLSNLNSDDSATGSDKDTTSELIDSKSIDEKNKDDEETLCLTKNIDFLMQCVEINLAMEYQVIQFDFYNDWINGMVYIPHWYGGLNTKKSYKTDDGIVIYKTSGCMDDSFRYSRNFVQQCALSYIYDSKTSGYTEVNSEIGCKSDSDKQKCHKAYGRKYVKIFGKKQGGVVHDELTLKMEHVYYTKPCQYNVKDGQYPTKCNLFATDIVMLGSLSSCNQMGIPTMFNHLLGSSYKLPSNLVQTNLETDGVLYSTSNGSVCRGVKSISEVKETNNYDEWSRTSESPETYTIGEDDALKLSEMSGIDWGFSGPSHNNDDFGNLYYPGGHFLGISCFNSEVNIKSCVNLSRMCEIGVGPSSYQEIQTGKNGENTIYVNSNGLVSKNDIYDIEVRNIFATLNFNGLKTKTNDIKYREYEFISSLPFNFGGELKKYVNNNSYNKSTNAESFYGNTESDITLNNKTLEDLSNDYYYFRLGLNKEQNKQNYIRSKYLVDDGISVALPVYENSFYFYFGIKDGSTAYDRFMHEYYSNCVDDVLTNLVVDTTVISNNTPCNKSSACSFVDIDGLRGAYSLQILHNGENVLINGWDNDSMDEYPVLMVDSEVYVDQHSGGTINGRYSRFYIGKCDDNDSGLTNGDYTVIIRLLGDDRVYKSNFTIKTDINGHFLNDINNNITEVDFNEEFEENKRNWGNMDKGGYLYIDFTMLNSEQEKQLYDITVYKEDDEECYFKGEFMIVDDKGHDILYLGDISKGDYDYLLETYPPSNPKTKVRIYVPYGNSNYKVKITIKCNEEGTITDTYEFENIIFVPMPKHLTFYIGKEHINDTFFKKLGVDLTLDYTIETNANKLGYSWYDYVTSGTPNINYDDFLCAHVETDEISPEDLFEIEKALTYRTSLVNETRHSIGFGITGGVPPYTIEYDGTGEKYNSDGTITIYSNVKNTIESEYSVNYNNFRLPTRYSWPYYTEYLKAFENEFNYYTTNRVSDKDIGRYAIELIEDLKLMQYTKDWAKLRSFDYNIVKITDSNSNTL